MLERCQPELFQQALDAIGDIQVYLDHQGRVYQLNDKAYQLLASGLDTVKGIPWQQLIQMREDLSSIHTQAFIDAAIRVDTLTKLQPIAVRCRDERSVLLDGMIAPLSDIGKQRGSVLLLRQLSRLDHLPDGLAHHIGDENKTVSGILLLSPDNFNHVNTKFGREVGDSLLYDIGEFLRCFARPGDLASHYGGTIYMLMFCDTSEQQMVNMSQRLQSLLLEHTFSCIDSRLGFSFGLALNNQDISYSPIELFYYANFCLSHAMEAGGKQLKHWQHQNILSQIGNLDKVSGKVSRTSAGDYHKMLMQWRIINQQGDKLSQAQFINSTLSHLRHGFNVEYCAFVSKHMPSVDVPKIATQLVARRGDEHLPAEFGISKQQWQTLQQGADEEKLRHVLQSVNTKGERQSIVGVYNKKQLLGALLLVSGHVSCVQKRDHHVLAQIADFMAITLTKFAYQPRQLTKSNNRNIDNFWYRSAAMQQLMDEVQLVAPTSATVLITGESGTGKEMLAKSIHHFSDRKDKPFIIFDCGAVVDNLLESELFGHVKGAFTGATSASPGAIAKADGGTLFLDEIGELPLDIQVKLLRFVQDKTYSRVGSSEVKRVDVRLVAATNVDLKQRAKQGLFREDLYYRLHVFELANVALRHRRDDILLIANAYLQVFNQEYDKQITSFSDDAVHALLDYPWPGNIRELKNVVHRAVIICGEGALCCRHLGLYKSDLSPEHKVLNAPQADALSRPRSLSVSASHVDNQAAAFDSTSQLTRSQAQNDWQYSTTVSGYQYQHAPPLSSSTIGPSQGASSAHNSAHNQATIGLTPWQGKSLYDLPSGSTPHNQHQTGSLIDQNWQSTQSLSVAVNALVSQVLEQYSPYQRLPGVALWLEHGLYKQALIQHNQVLLQAAKYLLLPEATLRRRWKKLQSQSLPSQAHTSALLEQSVAALLAEPITIPPVQMMQRAIIDIAQQHGLAANRACQLLAVSAPTFRKLKSRLIEI
ncbi:sigma 54-interacting transcriptional regulator [Thalassotalea ponticola]|uniref:sigma 54-interacting transcriptional regulator n=1 Tax=Thalassotalea ponticola TaxID=1523392 RepID=UPI0025B4E431|nr:sigma 54-interacting transcriptional regulator [Thalassotalea ponticola]MDN3652701.1 sigma 54-interacting transcriptional regulator [Thalassotalea ponticola]